MSTKICKNLLQERGEREREREREWERKREREKWKKHNNFFILEKYQQLCANISSHTPCQTILWIQITNAIIVVIQMQTNVSTLPRLQVNYQREVKKKQLKHLYKKNV